MKLKHKGMPMIDGGDMGASMGSHQMGTDQAQDAPQSYKSEGN